MDFRREFQAHADECSQMAAATKDVKSKATWNELAARWSAAASQQADMEERARALRLTREVVHRQPKKHGWLNNAIS